MSFITFEGCDGSGKTTQIKILEKALIANGHSCVVTREPGGTDLAQKIRLLLLQEEICDPLTEFTLLSAARRDHVENLIKPSLSAKKIVICDRFLDSSLVYQGMKKNLDLDLMIDIHKKIVGDLFPSITFILDLSVQQAIARMNLDSAREKNFYDLKSNAFHESIRNGFLLLNKKFTKRKMIVLDANKDVNELADEIYSLINFHILTK